MASRATAIVERQTESRHKRYRRHRAAREQNTQLMVQILKDKVLRGAIYVALLAQGSLLRPHRFASYRRAILSYCTDIFDAGVDSFDRIRTEKQATALRCHLHEACVVERKGILLPESIMKMWEIYTMLYDHLTVRFVSIEGLDQSSLALVHQVSMIITHRSIHFLLPHMLQNHHFMTSVIGKVLSYRIRYHVRFDQQNRLVYVNVEHQIAHAWMRLLHEAALVNVVLKHMRKIDLVFIQNHYHHLLNDFKVKD